MHVPCERVPLCASAAVRHWPILWCGGCKHACGYFQPCKCGKKKFRLFINCICWLHCCIDCVANDAKCRTRCDETVWWLGYDMTTWINMIWTRLQNNQKRFCDEYYAASTWLMCATNTNTSVKDHLASIYRVPDQRLVVRVAPEFVCTPTDFANNLQTDKLNTARKTLLCVLVEHCAIADLPKVCYFYICIPCVISKDIVTWQCNKLLLWYWGPELGHLQGQGNLSIMPTETWHHG